MNRNFLYDLSKKYLAGERVMTYGQVAKGLRLPGRARAAGRAMAACPAGRGISWHRVVGAGGKLLIHELRASLKRKLLETEGLTVAEKRIQNFRNYEWSSRQGTPPRIVGKKTPVRRMQARFAPREQIVL